MKETRKGKLPAREILIITPFALGIVTVLILMLAALCLVWGEKFKSVKRNAQVTEALLKTIQPSINLENSLRSILEIVSGILTARVSCIYVFDEKKNGYVLKAVRRALNEENGQPAPSYSGLFGYKKKTFHPPVFLDRSHLPEKAWITAVCETPVLAVPFGGGKVLVYMGPVKRVSRRAIRILDGLGEKTGQLLETLVELERKRDLAREVISSGKTVQKASSILMDDNAFIKSVVDISAAVIGASGGVFISKNNNRYTVITSEGLSNDITELLKSEPEIGSRMLEMAGTGGIQIIYKGQREYFKLPRQICAIGAETVLTVGINGRTGPGAAVFWYNGRENVEEYKLTALMVLTARIADISEYRMKIAKMSGSYTEYLKMIAEALDHLSPYTMGYSELMYRYAAVIAGELDLPLEEIYEIGLAAYLSNIGIIGLPRELFFKEGKFGELEYEMMKLHTDLGASIVGAAIANNRVASYIRYHHERMDGQGYPEGLKGEEIPLGARIIAVVQVFLAKIKGRVYRKPLPFEKAVEDLKFLAGTQLDPEIVSVFLGWFRKKQSNPKRKGKSLGECRELNCPPKSVCSNCLVYQRHERNCWEYRINNCREHGNECLSCYVYTEYLSRLKVGGSCGQKEDSDDCPKQIPESERFCGSLQ